MPLKWRHNEHDGVSNYQPHDCLLKRLLRRISKKTSKLRVTGLCDGNSPVTGVFPAQRASNAENVSNWRRHHAPSPLSCRDNLDEALDMLFSKSWTTKTWEITWLLQCQCIDLNEFDHMNYMDLLRNGMECRFWCMSDFRLNQKFWFDLWKVMSQAWLWCIHQGKYMLTWRTHSPMLGQ